MKLRKRQSCQKHNLGFTLIEITVVILVLLALIGISFSSLGSLGEWQRAKEVSNILRDIQVAQRQYLADHPQQDVSTVTAAQVAQYLPGSPSSLPAMVGNAGEVLTADVSVSPPVAGTTGSAGPTGAAGAFTPYDISGSTNDGLWDVGKR